VEGPAWHVHVSQVPLAEAISGFNAGTGKEMKGLWSEAGQVHGVIGSWRSREEGNEELMQ
jgi:hypothetical protein